MANRIPTNIRLTAHDRNLIAKLQCDFINELPPSVKGLKRMLSMSDVIRASIRHLALQRRDPAVLEQAYCHLLIEVVGGTPSEPFEAPDR